MYKPIQLAVELLIQGLRVTIAPRMSIRGLIPMTGVSKAHQPSTFSRTFLNKHHPGTLRINTRIENAGALDILSGKPVSSCVVCFAIYGHGTLTWAGPVAGAPIVLIGFTRGFQAEPLAELIGWLWRL